MSITHGRQSAAQPLRFRQIHLDFHTSEHIPGVGAQFDASRFQEMLRLGRVDSITLFSKCHHGWSYHDTSVGHRHPTMAGELLPRQIEACRAMDVNTPVYLSAGYDELAAREHPEWRLVSREGNASDPLSPAWTDVCFNSPYLDYLCDQVAEVVDRFDTDGIFLDIVWPKACYCSRCLRDMTDGGHDPEDPAQAMAFAREVLHRYYERTTAAARKNDSALRVVHNNGGALRRLPDFSRFISHLELESLPTGGWGYDHFPLTARYAATTGFDYLGMTGKFHTGWGEFGGFKREAALRYECAAMLAMGARCSVGDQLHPRGAMNEDTYRLIGAAYAEVEAKEPWCAGAETVADVALVSADFERARRDPDAPSLTAADEGAARMLLEGHILFVVVDTDADLTPYRLIILPDEITLAGPFAEKVRAYLAGGGKVLLSGVSGMEPDHGAFAVGAGLAVDGPGAWDPDYVIPGDEMPTPPARGPFVVHGGAMDVRPEGARPLAARARPYFNRAWSHFCSHLHTPDSEVTGYPAATTTGVVTYFAHRIFTAYRRSGQPLLRDMVMDAVRGLIGRPRVEVDLPSAGRLSLMRQPAENRDVLHLLYASPVLRGGQVAGEGRPVEIIEDLVPLHDVAVNLATDAPVHSVRLVPEGTELPFQTEGGRIRFTVPRLLCHQMVEIGYGR